MRMFNKYHKIEVEEGMKRIGISENNSNEIK